MRRLMLVTLLFVFAAVISKADLQACGNKILAGGRGVRYRLMRSDTPAASVLLYKKSSLPSDSRLKDPKLYSALKTVGHNYSIAADLSEFEANLRSGKYDLVIADPSDVADIREIVQTASSKPVVIPILASKKAGEDDYIKYIDKAIKSTQK